MISLQDNNEINKYFIRDKIMISHVQLYFVMQYAINIIYEFLEKCNGTAYSKYVHIKMYFTYF